MNVTRPVIAFALLRQCSDIFQADLLAGVSLLIKPLVSDLSGQIYDARVLADRMERAYGITLSSAVLEGFTPRLLAAGILQEEPINGGVTRAVYCEYDGEVFLQPEQEKEFQEVIDDFLSHAHNGLATAQIKPSDDQLTSSFLSHLSTLDFSSIKARPIVESSDDDRTILGPEAKERKSLSEQLAQGATTDVLVASYITKLHELNPERLSLLAKVADGALGVELVLDLQAPQSVPRLTATTAVIDTPILLAFLDLSTAQDHLVAKKLISQISQAGASIAVFQHTIEEAEGVLTAIQNARYVGEAYGPSVSRLSESVYRAYFDSMRGRISLTWTQSHKFELIQKTSTHFYKNFTQQDEENLTGQLRHTLQDRVLTRERDAKSVAETMRLLGGAHIPIGQVATCKFMFVTNNGSVRRLAARFLKNNGFVSADEFVPVITDRYIAGLCWLITGGKSNNSPSTARLLANCAAALRLRPALAERTKNFLSKLDDEKVRHFEALMTNDRASQYLMELTYGNPDVITAHNVEEIYEEIQRRIVEKVAKEKDGLYLTQLDELKNKISSSETEMVVLRTELNQVELDRQAKDIELQIHLQRATELEGQVVRQSEESLRHTEEISDLRSKFTTIAEVASKNENLLKKQKENAHKNAIKYSDKCVTAIRIGGAIFLIVLVFFLNYIDKFFIPHLSAQWQPKATFIWITIQTLLVLAGIGVFIDKFVGKPLERLRKRILDRRLQSLGIADETSGTN